MFEWIKKIFGIHKFHRHIYAVTTGTYVGEMLIFIQEVGDSYYFLSVPKNVNRKIPKEKFDFGIDNNILEFVEIAPRAVKKVAYKQFLKNESIN